MTEQATDNGSLYTRRSPHTPASPPLSQTRSKRSGKTSTAVNSGGKTLRLE